MFALILYKNLEGQSPVDDYIEGLPRNQKSKLLAYMGMLKEFGFSLKRPVANSLGGGLGLYELRPSRHRILYFFYQRNTVILLHAFLKQTDAIPRREIDTAWNRKMNYLKQRHHYETAW